MGAGGSKAAAAQKAASRAAAAAVSKPPPPAAATAPGATSAVSAAERQREAHIAQRLAAAAAAPIEQASDTEVLVASMNQLLSGVRQHQYEEHRNPEADKLYTVKKKTKEAKEAELVGRLFPPSLKQLLEEHAWSVRRGTPLSAATLARKYGASEAVLEQVLQYNAVPLVHADEGQLVGSWPAPGAGGSSEGGDKQEKSS